MTYEPKNFDHLLGLQGFSDQMLKNHFELYQGYVKNTNHLIEDLKELQEKGKADKPVFGEISRRLGWEWNGMRLHELYFGNMNKKPSKLPDDSKLNRMMNEQFGSYQNWLENFKAKGAMRGIGWVILFLDPERDYLINEWIDEHDTGHLAGAAPLLVLDVFEHAYSLDYGIKKDAYLEAFMRAVDWNEALHRFMTSPKKVQMEKFSSS